MPRNGAGQYSPTAGIPVVSGTTISSTAINNVLDDLGDEITASLPVSGVAPMTGVLRVTLGSVSAPGLAFVGDTDTGLYSTGANSLSLATNGTAALTVSATQTTTWTAKATGKAFDVDAITDVASAATCDIGAAATSEVNVTGTTTITSFGTSNAGIVRRGTFAGALTLTHNGTSLILPGGANITTAAGDSFVARSLGSGNWRVLSYQRASGLAVAVSTQVLTAGTAQATTSGTSIDFTSIPSWVRRLSVVLNGVSTSGTSPVIIQLGAGSVTTSGYLGSADMQAASGGTTAAFTTGLGIERSGAATAAMNREGIATFIHIGSNVWVGTYIGSTDGTATVAFGSTRVTLGGTLDRVRLTTSGGSDTFDAGSVNILYE